MVMRSPGYPEVGTLSLTRLVGSLVGAAARPGGWRPALHDWVGTQTARHGNANLVFSVLGRRFLLVTGQGLSAEILRPAPSASLLVTGERRRRAMAFLAPRALTISADADWVRRREHNEHVLATGRPHDDRQAHLDAVHRAFATGVGSVDAVRDAMGRVMLAVVFGGDGPRDLPREVARLMGVVRSPARRVLVGRLEAGRRARFYEELRAQWHRAPAISLVGRFRDRGVPPSTEALEQIPHWMFTFVLSGTDLLTRALALIGSRPEALRRAQREIEAAGPLERAAAIDGLVYVEACIREAGRLFAPVPATSHLAPRGADLDGHHVPAGTTMVHYLPLTQRRTPDDPTADDFVPRRWLESGSETHRRYPNLFLSGARECPGRDLIMFVCKAAVANQIGRHGARVEAPSLRSDPLPLAFPARQLRFRAQPRTDERG